MYRSTVKNDLFGITYSRGHGKSLASLLARIAELEPTPDQTALVMAIVRDGTTYTEVTEDGFKIIPYQDVRDMRPDVVVLDDLAMCPIDSLPHLKPNQLDNRFNAEPIKSTFTPKIHRKTKRW